MEPLKKKKRRRKYLETFIEMRHREVISTESRHKHTSEITNGGVKDSAVQYK